MDAHEACHIDPLFQTPRPVAPGALEGSTVAAQYTTGEGIADYILKLKNAPEDPVLVETLRAFDDGEAQDLAMIRLMGPPDFRVAELWLEDHLAGHLVRDGQRFVRSTDEGPDAASSQGSSSPTPK